MGFPNNPSNDQIRTHSDGRRWKYKASKGVWRIEPKENELTADGDGSNLANVDASTLDGLNSTDFSHRYSVSKSNVNNSGWTTVASVDGNGLASLVRMTVAGTGNNVVVSSVIDISVNHYKDIFISSMNGEYRLLYVRIASNNNEDFTIQIKTNHNNNATLICEIQPLNGENVNTSNPTIHSLVAHEHTCYPGTSKTGTNNGDVADIDHDLRIDGKYYGDGSQLTGIESGAQIQTVSLLKTTQGSQTLTGTDSVINGLSKSITPLGNNSKFLVQVRWFGETYPAWNMVFNIHMNSSRVNMGGSTSRGYGLTMPVLTYYSSNQSSTPEMSNFSTLVETSSTAGTAITFSFVGTGSSGNCTLWNNRCYSSSTSTAYERGTSEIIITEIAG